MARRPLAGLYGPARGKSSAGKVVALLEKRVDAILGGLDDQYFLVKQKGANPAGMKFADHGANTVGLTILANQSTLDSKPDLVKRFNDINTEPMSDDKATPAAAERMLLSEIDRWAPIIKSTGFKLE